MNKKIMSSVSEINLWNCLTTLNCYLHDIFFIWEENMALYSLHKYTIFFILPLIQQIAILLCLRKENKQFGEFSEIAQFEGQW